MRTITRRPRYSAVSLAAVIILTPAVALASQDFPLEPVKSPGSVAQSVQLRVNADGTPNGQAIDYRWSVTQVTIPGPDIPESVTVPEQGVMLRSLETFSYPPQDPATGTAELPISDQGSYGTARTVSLVPQDYKLPVAITTEFTLDGEPISATDLVGQSGLVTATYTVKNLSSKTYKVPITSVSGEEVTKTVTADVPMVAEATTLLPQRFTDLNMGTGLGGADGRGNTMAKWIALPFSPIHENGAASFGWAANVTDAVIPSMLVQVLPVYIPKGHGEEEEPADEGGTGGGGESPFPPVAPPNMSPAVAEIKGGVAQLVEGLQGFANSGDGEDPLTTLEGRINGFFTEMGINLTEMSDALAVLPPRLEKSLKQIEAAQEGLIELNRRLTQLDEALDTARIDDIRSLSDNWPTISQRLQQLNVILPRAINWLTDPNIPIDCSVPDPTEPSRPGTIGVGEVNRRILVDKGGEYQGFVTREGKLPRNPNLDDAYTFGRGVNAGGALWGVPEGGTDPEWLTRGTLPSSRPVCEGVITAAERAIPRTERVQDLLATLERLQPAIARLAQIPALSPDNAAEVQRVLRLVSDELPGILTVVAPLTKKLSEALTPLQEALVRLSDAVYELRNQLRQAGAKAAGKKVDLPMLDQVVSGIVDQALASPNGQLVTGGIDQAGGGVASAKAELSAYVANLVASLQTGLPVVKSKVQTAVGEVKTKLTEAGQQIDAAKATVAGMKKAAAQSPLPYGGKPSEAPKNTELAGAYEFRMDAADNEAPSTDVRVILGLITLVGAGLVGAKFAPTFGGKSGASEGKGNGGGGSGSGNGETVAMGDVLPGAPPPGSTGS